MKDVPPDASAPASATTNVAGNFLRWAFWVICSIVMLLLVTQPVSSPTQLMLATAVVLGLFALRQTSRSDLNRHIFLALGSVVILRYLYWRLSETLPPVSDSIGFGFGIVVLGAELFCAFVMLISLVINADPLTNETPVGDDDGDLPTVDVFIPCYNEPLDILSMTIAAAAGMDYPADKLHVWLLDDGGTDEKCTNPDPAVSDAARQRKASLQSLCRELGVKYLTRVRNEHAKAGNLNNGLKHSTSEIVVIFDADHVPFRQFLLATIGHFARDPKLFLVQTPHVFLNPDPFERNLRTFGEMPSESEMFYAVTQRGLDKWNSSFFCGSAALMRRTALEQNGGFAGQTVTEDCETAVELHARGWTSLYVEKPLVAGLQPETFESFILQRSRWCQGMIQNLLMKNPLTVKGLTPIQRVAYLSSMTFWLFPAPRLIFMLAPLLYIFFDIKIFVSNFGETLAYTASYVTVNALMQSYLYGHVRWPWMSELYEYVQGVYLTKAIASVIVSPRKPSFNVTAKGTSQEDDRLSELAWPFFALFGLMTLGIATALWRYFFDPGVTDLILIVGTWALFNFLIAGVALGVVAERRQLHRYPQLEIARTGVFSLHNVSVPVRIVEVSANGCSIVMEGSPAAFDHLSPETSGTLAVTPLGGDDASRPVAVHLPSDAHLRSGLRQQLTFAGETVERYRTVAELMYGDARAIEKFLQRRRSPVGIFAGSARFALWGLTQPFRALSYAFRAQSPTAIPAPVAAVERTPAFDPNAFASALHELASELPENIRTNVRPTAPFDATRWLGSPTGFAKPPVRATAPLVER